VTLGARRVVRDIVVTELRTPAEALSDGSFRQIGATEQDRFNLSGFDFTYNFAEASAAMVYDNSLSSYTSPFSGQRYRLEVTPTVGTVNFVSALADYRKYFFLRPFTLAFQGMHFGRYGDLEADEGAGDLFNPIFLGQNSLVRGYYEVYRDCYDSVSACDNLLFENLFGSRIAIAKAELRFPLIQALVLGPGIGFPPIEGFGFVDAGTAWNSGESPTFQTGAQINDERGILASAGVGGRINLLGYAVLEVDYVRAFERDAGWSWVFAFQPGF
jgi:outer membrane protein assembly factor BamA